MLKWGSSSTGSTPSPSAFSENSNSSLSNFNVSSSHGYSPDSSYFQSHHDNHSGPYLEITEQAYPQFRFRYKSEMQGTHGAIQGVSTSKKHKTFPTVKLCNYNGQAIIRCTLCTAESKTLHVHRLVGKSTGGGEKEDPHDIFIGSHLPNGCLASFQNLVIIHVAKKHLVKELVEKKKRVRLANYPNSSEYAVITKDILAQFEKEAEEETKKMDMNCAVLKFEALFFNNDHYTPIPNCEPVYSNKIKNLKCHVHGQLKICRMDRVSGSCEGGEEIFLLVEKVGKDNIKVIVTENDDYGNAIWSDYCNFTAADVHHQFAIVCKTPKYRFTNIKEKVTVDIQLERISDGARSEPKQFSYLPTLRESEDYNFEITKSKKRKLVEDISTNTIGSVCRFPSPPQQLDVTSTTFEIPAKIVETSVYHDLTNPLYTFNCTQLQNNVNDLEGSLFIAPAKIVAEDDNVSTERSMSFTHLLGTLPTPDICDIRDMSDIFNTPDKKSGDMSIFPNSQLDIPIFYDMLTDGVAETKEISSPGIQASTLAPVTCKNLEALVNNSSKKYIFSNKTSVTDDNDALNIDGDHDISDDIDTILLKRTSIGNSIVHAAVIYKQLTELRYLIEFLQKHNRTELINWQQPATLQTPLHLAVNRDGDKSEDDVEVVNILLEAGADPCKLDRDSRSPLHVAVKSDFKDAVILLLESSLVDVNGVSDIDGTALHIASENNQVELAKLLIEYGADVNAINKKTGRTALHVAVINENPEIVSLLVDQENLIIDKEDFNGYTPLQVSILNEYRPWKRICKQLIKHGAFYDSTVMKKKNSAETRNYFEEGNKTENIENEIDFNINLLFSELKVAG